MNKLEKIKEKPKFKIGDSIRNKQWPTACHTIESMDSEAYYLENGGKVEISNQDLWELKEEPVNSNLEEAAHFYVDTTIEHFDSEGNPCCYPAFIAGAQWQKERVVKWLNENKDHPFIGCEDPCLSGYLTDEFIEDFKEAMEK